MRTPDSSPWLPARNWCQTADIPTCGEVLAQGLERSIELYVKHLIKAARYDYRIGQLTKDLQEPEPAHPLCVTGLPSLIWDLGYKLPTRTHLYISQAQSRNEVRGAEYHALDAQIQYNQLKKWEETTLSDPTTDGGIAFNRGEE